MGEISKVGLAPRGSRSCYPALRVSSVEAPRQRLLSPLRHARRQAQSRRVCRRQHNRRITSLDWVPTVRELATNLDRANDEVIAFAMSCSAEEWAEVVSGDGWPVGVVLHHIAEGYDLVSRWIESALVGHEIEDTADGIDSANLRHAEHFASVDVEATVALLRTNGAAAVRRIIALDDSDLQKSTPFGPANGVPLSVAQFCAVAVGHVRGHLDRARLSLRGDTGR